MFDKSCTISMTRYILSPLFRDNMSITCAICKKVFANKYSLAAHKSRYHKKEIAHKDEQKKKDKSHGYSQNHRYSPYRKDKIEMSDGDDFSTTLSDDSAESYCYLVDRIDENEKQIEKFEEWIRVTNKAIDMQNEKIKSLLEGEGSKSTSPLSKNLLNLRIETELNKASNNRLTDRLVDVQYTSEVNAKKIDKICDEIDLDIDKEEESDDTETDDQAGEESDNKETLVKTVAEDLMKHTENVVNKRFDLVLKDIPGFRNSMVVLSHGFVGKNLLEPEQDDLIEEFVDADDDEARDLFEENKETVYAIFKKLENKIKNQEAYYNAVEEVSDGEDDKSLMEKEEDDTDSTHTSSSDNDSNV